MCTTSCAARTALASAKRAVCSPSGSDALDYDQHMLDKVDALAKTYHMPWTLREILPCVLCAGEDAGVMTAEGAKLLDPTARSSPAR